MVEKTFVGEDGQQVSSQATYSPFHLKQMIDPLGNQTSLTHDAAGRITKSTLEWTNGSISKEFVYDIHDNLLFIKEPFRETRFQRDDKHQLISYSILDQYEQALISKIKQGQDKAQVDEDYQYLNSLGQRVLQTKVTDEVGVTTITTHDALGHVVETEQRDSLGNTLSLSRYLYDAAGNRAVESHGIDNNIIIENLYGPNNRLESTSEGSRTTHYLYNNKGQLQRVLKPDGVQLFFLYDGMGRVEEFSSSDHNRSLHIPLR